MQRKTLYIFISLLAFVLVYSCRKDPPPGGEGGFKTTPYILTKPYGFSNQLIPAYNPMTHEGVALGRKLFYDPILSKTYTQSCASCHNPQFAFTDMGKRFSTGVDGITGDKNAMAIFNLAYNTSGFFWDGRSSTLEIQALQPIKNPIEMHMSIPEVVERLNQDSEYRGLFKKAFNADAIDSQYLSYALAQFMRSIQSYSSPFDKGQMSPAAQQGYAFFQKIQVGSDPYFGDCIHCHQSEGSFGAKGGKEFANNGLDANPAPGRAAVTGNPNDVGKFKVPSLRNLLLTAPYMHDGRFKTLEEVVDFYDTGFYKSPTLDVNLALHLDANGKPIPRMTPLQKAQLVEFLKSLTDTVFIHNPEYTKP